MDTNEIYSHGIVLLRMRFNKVLKMMDRKSRPNVKNNQTKGNKFNVMNVRVLVASNQNVLRFSRKRKMSCLSLGHMMIQKESLTMKQLNMSLLLLVGANLMNDTCDDDVSCEELVDSYKKFYAKSEEICKEGKKTEENHRKIAD